MRKTRETARRDGQNATAGAGAVKAAKIAAEFRSEVWWFVHDWGRGGHLAADARAAYDALIKKARGREAEFAAELRKAKRALDYATTHAITMVPPGEVRPGLRVEFGIIQWPEAEALDVEVYDARGALVEVVKGRAEAGRGLSREDAEAVNEYLRLAGARA